MHCVVVTAGYYDLLVEDVSESDEHLLEVIPGQMRATDAVAAHRRADGVRDGAEVLTHEDGARSGVAAAAALGVSW